MTPSLSEIAADLQQHHAVAQEILALIEKEGRLLKDPNEKNPFQLAAARKSILPKLNQVLDNLRRHRLSWQRLSPAQRSGCSEITALLRQNQNVIMRILMLDRENEQTLLRRGLVPARQLPPANRERPHFVAKMYRRNASG